MVLFSGPTFLLLGSHGDRSSGALGPLAFSQLFSHGDHSIGPRPPRWLFDVLRGGEPRGLTASRRVPVAGLRAFLACPRGYPPVVTVPWPPSRRRCPSLSLWLPTCAFAPYGPMEGNAGPIGTAHPRGSRTGVLRGCAPWVTVVALLPLWLSASRFPSGGHGAVLGHMQPLPHGGSDGPRAGAEVLPRRGRRAFWGPCPRICPDAFVPASPMRVPRVVPETEIVMDLRYRYQGASIKPQVDNVSIMEHFNNGRRVFFSGSATRGNRFR